MSLANWRTYQSTISSGQESVTVASWKTSSGEYPEPNFEFQRRIYDDPDVFTAINFIKNRALGEGFHFSCAAQDIPNYARTECETYLTEFFESIHWGTQNSNVGLEPLANIVMQELGWGGTHLLELLDDPEDITALAPVPLTSIWKWNRDRMGNDIAIHQFPQVNSSPLTPSKYLTYKWNSIDASAWGHGLAWPLSRPRIGPRGEVMPPLIQVWWQMQDDARKRLHRYAVPRAIFGVPGMDQTSGKSVSEALKDPDSGASFLTNAPVTVAMDSPTARGNFQPEFDLIRNRIDIGLNSMLGTMIASDKGFSFASSSNGFTAVDIIVWDLQNTFKCTTDFGLVAPVATQGGYDARMFKPGLVYNIPDKPAEYAAADIDKAFVDGSISLEESRATYKQLMKWPLSDAIPPELIQKQLAPPPPMGMALGQHTPGQPTQQGQQQPPQKPHQQQVDPRMAALAAPPKNGHGQQSVGR